MATMVSNRRPTFGINCVRCKDELIAPERSEYRGAYQYDEDDQGAEDQITHERIRHERYTVLMDLTLVSGQTAEKSSSLVASRPERSMR